MRRPEDTTRKMLDGPGAALAATVLVASLADGPVWTLPICIAFAALFLLMGRRSRRGDFRIGVHEGAIMALYALGALALILAGTPLAPGGVHPMWALVGFPGAASIDLQSHLIGLLQLAGLGFLFAAAARSGLAAKTQINALSVLIGAGAAFALVVCMTEVLGLEVAIPGSPLLFDDGVKGAMFGVVGLLSADRVLRTLRSGAGGNGGRLRSLGSKTPLSLAALLLSLLALELSTPTYVWVSVAVLLVLMIAWSLLTAGGHKSIPVRVLRWLLPATAVLAIVIGAIGIGALPKAHVVKQAASAHLQAIDASPWLGYGLGSGDAVTRLIMTRTNFFALNGAPGAPDARLAGLEQGGYLATLPLALMVVWLTVAALLASIRSRSSGSTLRAIVCCSVFLALLGLKSASAVKFPVEAIWILILGLSFKSVRAND
jgi:hypothetical protein